MKKKDLLNYLYVLLGTMSLSFGAVTLLSPNEIITGGGIGIALLVHYVFPNLTLGTYIILVSAPFIIVGYIYYGKKYTIKTLITMLLLSFFTDFFKEVLELKPLVNDILLGAVFGGIFVGFGVGFIMKGKSSTGSTSISGELIASKTKFKVSEILLAQDAVILISSIFVYGDIKKSFYSLIGVYITSKIVDMVLTGRPSKKVVHIISNKVEDLTVHIRERIEEHGAVITGVGLHKGQDKNIIFVAVETNKIQLLRDIISKHDPEAFLIISEASEILGRGTKI
ncbi:YitT family protein [Arcobacter sp. F2176]|uniref:YitT family protein n=1 Tax=Arcobacter sp. F2176 TaxID=2044511 RepID=UPI00100C24F2|nr:YitT family protein [Arcobacter sp. F2176]RXJ82311.1 membrane protein [Arcobacter sp. F2176]